MFIDTIIIAYLINKKKLLEKKIYLFYFTFEPDEICLTALDITFL